MFKHLQRGRDRDDRPRGRGRSARSRPRPASDVLEEFHTMWRAVGVRHPRRRRVRAEAAGQVARPGHGARASSIASSSRSSRRPASPTLEKADPQQLSKFILGEHPQTIALILAHLKPAQAAQLAQLAARRPARRRADADGQPRRDLAGRHHPHLGGHRAAAEGARRPRPRAARRRARRRRAVQPPRSRRQPAGARAIETESPDLAVSIRNLMFVFDDLLARRGQRRCARSSSAPTRRR